MDCVSGQLLLYRLRGRPDIEKETLFTWMWELLGYLEQYQRCRDHRGYRYVNPYSVLVTAEDRLLLLDLEAESNDFVLKNMQKQAMRSHFVKPIVSRKENARESLELYGYGKTIQFIMANTEITPDLTRKEEHQIEKVIQKCIGEHTQKQYEDLKQVQKDVRAVKEKRELKWKKYIGIAFIIGIFICSAVVAWVKVNNLEIEKKQLKIQIQQEEKRKSMDQIELEKKDEEEENAVAREIDTTRDGLEAMEEEIQELEMNDQETVSRDNIEIIWRGEKIEKKLLHYLAEAYDQEEQTDNAIGAYERLIVVEEDSEILKQSYIRIIALTLERDGKEAAQKVADAAEDRISGFKELEEYQELKETNGLE